FGVQALACPRLCEYASSLIRARASEFGVQALACPPSKPGRSFFLCENASALIRATASEFGVQALACPPQTCPPRLAEAPSDKLKLELRTRTTGLLGFPRVFAQSGNEAVLRFTSDLPLKRPRASRTLNRL